MRPVERDRGFRGMVRRLRFRWNASAHYHAWLLSQIPPHAKSVLDVGCGDGRLTRRLSARGLDVDAIDRSADMITIARGGSPSQVRWIHGDILDPTPLRDGGYDVVIVVATLHHMPLEAALARLRALVGIDGTLLIIGLFRAESFFDTIVSALGVPFHFAIGTYRSQRTDADTNLLDYDPRMPINAPLETLSDIRAAVRAALPGADVRRRLFWRYTLRWRRERDSVRAAEAKPEAG